MQPLPTLPVYNLVDEERLVTVYGPLFGRDRARGRRKATLADLQNFIVEPMDLPFQLRHMDIAYAHVRYGDGDFMGDSIAFGAAADSILRFSAFSVAKIEVGVT